MVGAKVLLAGESVAVATVERHDQCKREGASQAREPHDNLRWEGRERRGRAEG